MILLFQLAPQPTKGSGRGLSIAPGKDATGITHFVEFARKGNFTIKIDFKQYPQLSLIIIIITIL